MLLLILLSLSNGLILQISLCQWGMDMVCLSPDKASVIIRSEIWNY